MSILSAPSPSVLKRQLAKLDRDRERIVSQLESPRPVSPLKQPLWSVVQEYLVNHGASSFEDLTDALVAAGHNLGKYPKRTVSSCLTSPHVGNVFRLHTIGGVRMVEARKSAKSVPYMPAPYRKTQATRAVAAH